MDNMFDTYDAPGVAAKAVAIQAAGYHAVGLYYFKESGFKKLLTKQLAKQISNAGLYIVSVYENGFPIVGSYFTVETANMDAHVAHTRAADAGQPEGSTIYFAVDYDAPHSDLPAIEAYFTELRRVFDALKSTIEIGVYGSGLVCKSLTEKGLVAKTWLSQSTGFAGYSDWKAHANIAQGPVVNLFGMDCDRDTTNGDAGGWKL